MKIGSHVGNSGKEMLLGSAKEALSYGANCFMVYMGAPQNTYRKRTDEMCIKEMQVLLAQNNINLNDVIVHCPYIVNLAQSDPVKHQFAVDFLIREIKLIDAVGAKIMVLHPGAHVGVGVTKGCEIIADGINEIIAATKNSNVVIALETMAGKGTECGSTFEEIKTIIDGIKDQSRIGVCLDTCHISDAGYPLVTDYEKTIELFDEIVGLKYLKVIHINDSKNPCASHKDRHENIGFGYIGFDTIAKVVFDTRFKDIPKILETPYIPSLSLKDKSYPPYKLEIAMLRANKFDPELKNKVIAQYE